MKDIILLLIIHYLLWSIVLYLSDVLVVGQSLDLIRDILPLIPGKILNLVQLGLLTKLLKQKHFEEDCDDDRHDHHNHKIIIHNSDDDNHYKKNKNTKSYDSYSDYESRDDYNKKYHKKPKKHMKMSGEMTYLIDYLKYQNYDIDDSYKFDDSYDLQYMPSQLSYTNAKDKRPMKMDSTITLFKDKDRLKDRLLNRKRK